MLELCSWSPTTTAFLLMESPGTDTVSWAPGQVETHMGISSTGFSTITLPRHHPPCDPKSPSVMKEPRRNNIVLTWAWSPAPQDPITQKSAVIWGETKRQGFSHSPSLLVSWGLRHKSMGVCHDETGLNNCIYCTELILPLSTVNCEKKCCMPGNVSEL